MSVLPPPRLGQHLLRTGNSLPLFALISLIGLNLCSFKGCLNLTLVFYLQKVSNTAAREWQVHIALICINLQFWLSQCHTRNAILKESLRGTRFPLSAISLKVGTLISSKIQPRKTYPSVNLTCSYTFMETSPVERTNRPPGGLKSECRDLISVTRPCLNFQEWKII